MYENTEARVHTLLTTLSKVSYTEMATGQALRLRMETNLTPAPQNLSLVSMLEFVSTELL